MADYRIAPLVPTEEMLLKAGKSPSGVSPRGGTDWLGKMLPKYYRAMMTAAPYPPPGLLLSLGDGTAIALPEKVIEGIAERIAGKMLQRRIILFEDQSFDAKRVVRDILNNPEAIKEEIAHAIQQAQEARDVG